ncbi:MAG: hypothetical protein ACFNL1_06760, partial [Prevotella histicola]
LATIRRATSRLTLKTIDKLRQPLRLYADQLYEVGRKLSTDLSQLIDALMVTKTFLESFLLKSTLCSISFCKVISLTAID